MTTSKITPFPKLFSVDELDNLPNVAPITTVQQHTITIRSKIPRIANAIELLWGTVELQQYLANLIIDDQHYETGISRQGFDPDVMHALLAIHNAHIRFMAGDVDVWSTN